MSSPYRERANSPSCGGPAWSELANGRARGTILQYDCAACQEAPQRVPVAVPELIAPAELDDEPVGMTDDELAEPMFTIAADVPRDTVLAMLDQWVPITCGCQRRPA